jgi:hypothetical protein
VIALMPVALPVGDCGLQYSPGGINLTANHSVSRFFNTSALMFAIILRDWRDWRKP